MVKFRQIDASTRMPEYDPAALEFEAEPRRSLIAAHLEAVKKFEISFLGWVQEDRLFKSKVKIDRGVKILMTRRLADESLQTTVDPFKAKEKSTGLHRSLGSFVKGLGEERHRK